MIADSRAFGQIRRVWDTAIQTLQDHKRYEQMLGVGPPWCVRSVELNRAEGQLPIQFNVDGSSIPACPVCSTPAPVHDHREQRWRHLDTMQYRTIPIASVHRVNCSVHGVHGIAVALRVVASRCRRASASMRHRSRCATTT